MKKILFILLFLPALLQAQNLRRWGGTGAISTLHGNWFYNAHPTYSLADSLKLVDLRLLKDTAAALRSAIGSGGGGMSIGGAVTSGTAGSVLFLGTGGALRQDNSSFFFDSTNKRLGIGTNSPSYKLDILRVATGQTATTRAFNVSTTGSTFNMTSAAYTNHAGYFAADAAVSTGAFGLTNIGVMGMATGGDNNFGVATSNSSYTGLGYFYQSANNTTRLQGGPSTDNIQFGPDNRIRFNTPNIIASGSFCAGAANSDNGIGAVQVYGKITVKDHDIGSNSDSAVVWDRSTQEYKYAKINGSSNSDLTGGAIKTNIQIVNDADYTVASTDYIVLYKTMTAGRTVTLPSAASSTNRMLIIKNGGGGSFTITTSIAIRSNSSTTTTSVAVGQSVAISSDGTDWWIIWIH